MTLQIIIDKLTQYLLSNYKSSVASFILKPKFTAKVDSGATKHFFKQDHLQYFSSVKKLFNGPLAQLPNKQLVQATHVGYLRIHEDIPDKGSEVLIFPHLTNESLISVG